MHSDPVLQRGVGTSAVVGTTAASVLSSNESRRCITTEGGGQSCGDRDATVLDEENISAPSSPQLTQRSHIIPPESQSTEHAHSQSGEHAQNDSLILEDGVLRSLRDSNQDLSACVGGGGGAPLSPRPWYKRSIARDDKRTAGTGTNSGKKKSKSPDNLPEIQPGREGITIKENFEEKYSYFTRKVPPQIFR